MSRSDSCSHLPENVHATGLPRLSLFLPPRFWSLALESIVWTLTTVWSAGEGELCRFFFLKNAKKKNYTVYLLFLCLHFSFEKTQTLNFLVQRTTVFGSWNMWVEAGEGELRQANFPLRIKGRTGACWGVWASGRFLWGTEHRILTHGAAAAGHSSGPSLKEGLSNLLPTRLPWHSFLLLIFIKHTFSFIIRYALKF